MSETDRVCDRPNCAKPAKVQLTEVVDDKTSTQYLCKSCAEEKGLNAPSGQPRGRRAGFLDQLTQADDADQEGAAPDPCAFCGLSLEEFRRTGRLGCPQCYTAFESGLRGLLDRIHGAARHAGKVYNGARPGGRGTGTGTSATCGGRLGSAVEREDFERAAKLRDQIRELEPAGS